VEGRSAAEALFLLYLESRGGVAGMGIISTLSLICWPIWLTAQQVHLWPDCISSSIPGPDVFNSLAIPAHQHPSPKLEAWK